MLRGKVKSSRGLPPARQSVHFRAAGITEAQQFGDLVECLPCSVIQRSAKQSIAPVALDVE